MANTGTGTNYYEVLEVVEDAPPHEIHKAYQRAKSTYSSDNPALYSMFSQDEARELLRLIEEAYTVLGNSSLRKSYDEARARGEVSSHVALVLPTQGAAQVAPHAHATVLSHPAVVNGYPASSSVQPTAMHAVSFNSSSGPSNSSPNGLSNGSANNIANGHQVVPMNAGQGAIHAAHHPSTNPAQIANEHRQLPDFPLPSSSIEKSMEMPTSTMKSTLPPGMGRTQLSTYKIDESFENELKEAADFDGSLLQRTRLYKNISIDRLSEATRISRSYLMAVETNDYKSLPAAVFTRGFIVQVARVLGLADQKVAASYIKMFRAGGGK